MYNREAGTWRERLARSGITGSERTTPTAREAREWEAFISYLAKPRYRGFRQIAFSYRSPDFGASLGQVRDND
jgi:hypothetical protein